MFNLFRPNEKRKLHISTPSQWRGLNRSYDPFVIFGHARSGSSLLVKLLQSHPNVLCFGELFVRSRIGFSVESFDNFNPDLLEMRDSKPELFLNEYVFSPYKKEVHSVGFKLFPEQIDSNEIVWNWLSDNSKLKVIHLERSNRFAAFCSQKMAQKTGKYGINDKNQRLNETLILDPLECLQYFELREQMEQKGIEFFANHDVLKLDYEDLDHNIDETLAKILNFLGVAHTGLKTDKLKQEVRPLTEVVENYAELKKYFAETKWLNLFF
ncbi:sulfotransferase [Salibacteraceae bacterium]|nr:sulfotransferase [Salibacteraceae bacterium]